MGWVAGARGTMTAGATTPSVDGDEAGGQKGSSGLELFDPGQELASDEGGVLGNVHEKRKDTRVGITEKYIYLSEKQAKKAPTKNILERIADGPQRGACYEGLAALRQGAKNRVFLSAESSARKDCIVPMYPNHSMRTSTLAA